MGASPAVVTLGDRMQLDSGYTPEAEWIGLTVGLNIRVRKGKSFLFFPDEKFNTRFTTENLENPGKCSAGYLF